jgi:hypothetical protein
VFFPFSSAALEKKHNESQLTMIRLFEEGTANRKEVR